MVIMRISFKSWTKKVMKDFVKLLEKMEISHMTNYDKMEIEIEDLSENTEIVETLLELSQVGEIVRKWE